MTTSSAYLIRKAFSSKNHKLAVLLALHASIEYDKVVNLANAYGVVREVITPVEWRSHLSALAREGKYTAMQGEFNGDYGTVV